MFPSLFLLAFVISSPISTGVPSMHAAADRPFNNILVIVMENHGLHDIIGNPDAPFMNKLALTYSLSTNYTAVNHPSLPNYLALISGQDFASWSTSDCNPAQDCSAGNAANIVDSLEAQGLTWKAYMEDYPSSCGSHCSPGDCYTGDTGTGAYAARHDPFVYFDDIVNSPSRCSRIVPANASLNGGPDGQLLEDLSSPHTASNFMWLTPNLCNDIHDCPVSQGDAYLSTLVPKILGSELFTHKKATLFITFDEGDNPYPNDYVYSVWAGPEVRRSFESSIQHSHYSLMKTLELAWKLPSLTSNDANAKPMLEFFIPKGHCGNQLGHNSQDSTKKHSQNENSHGHEHQEASSCPEQL